MNRLCQSCAVTALFLLIISADHSFAGADEAVAYELKTAQQAHGHYLTVAANCMGCHTAAEGIPYAGGRAIETPFGVVYSRNLTPDQATGIGLWTDDDFYRALHSGISRDDSHLYPACPYPNFTHITENDAAAIKAFLDTLPPINNPEPENELSWPISQRGVMSLWNFLFFDEAETGATSTAESIIVSADRGAYLVEALGHCGACHTPKNFLGAGKPDARFEGGEVQHWLAPNNTGDERIGLGSWTEDEIVEYLQTGRNARDLASGPMAEVVERSTSRLIESDLRAIARYLKQLPPAGPEGGFDAPAPLIMASGEAIFIDACAACHQISGEAVPRMFTPLKGSAIVQASDPLSVIRVILHGTRVATTDAQTTPFTMPAFAWKLNDKQVAAVATYIRNAWGNAASPVTAKQVAQLREELAQQPIPDVP